jgi:hypothetical protein
MIMPIFTRFTETIDKKEDKRVVSVTVKPVVTDCTGTVWFTDLMLQEGDDAFRVCHQHRDLAKEVCDRR